MTVWSLTEKVDVRDIVVAHAKTLTRSRSGANGVVEERVSVLDVVLFYACPAALGIVAAVAGVRVDQLSEVLTTLAILAGFLFALLVLMFERIVVDVKADEPASGQDPVTNTWELFANVAYSVLVTTGAVILVGVGVLLGIGSVSGVASAALLAVLAHIALTLLMVIRRTFYLAQRVAGRRRLPASER